MLDCPQVGIRQIGNKKIGEGLRPLPFFLSNANSMWCGVVCYVEYDWLPQLGRRSSAHRLRKNYAHRMWMRLCLGVECALGLDYRLWAKC